MWTILTPLVLALLATGRTHSTVSCDLSLWLAWTQVAAIWSIIGPGPQWNRQLIGWIGALTVSLVFGWGRIGHRLGDLSLAILNWMPTCFMVMQIPVFIVSRVLDWQLESSRSKQVTPGRLQFHLAHLFIWITAFNVALAVAKSQPFPVPNETRIWERMGDELTGAGQTMPLTLLAGIACVVVLRRRWPRWETILIVMSLGIASTAIVLIAWILAMLIDVGYRLFPAHFVEHVIVPKYLFRLSCLTSMLTTLAIVGGALIHLRLQGFYLRPRLNGETLAGSHRHGYGVSRMSRQKAGRPR